MSDHDKGHDKHPRLAELETMVRDGRIDTIVVAITDMQGRLVGKRVQGQAFLDGVRSFTMTDEAVERIHARFDDLGEQLHKMHCTYPFGGWPGQEDCRFEPPVTYDSDARKPVDG